jgi:hypothetical protein
VNLSLSGLGIVCLLIFAALFWYDSMRVREAANVIAASTCHRQGLQFLDGTVALSALRPRLAGGGVRLERTYVFDYTVDGVLRASGFIIMLGRHLQHVGLAREH